MTHFLWRQQYGLTRKQVHLSTGSKEKFIFESASLLVGKMDLGLAFYHFHYTHHYWLFTTYWITELIEMGQKLNINQELSLLFII